ncbi:MutS-related protein [Aureibacter tunicatorum]|uniref:DNA mismatch repair ATPase MutS n=1 Tax=Aureibacter tunicatorum TaxID=866807 RepID=A0AAE3XIS5_9BACT|nr:hypothetical protein [Aureibacter tunicatorum]MDR6237483.1 DNA mismatch repair ATPase MutS [Aureibacter tunicatorum]BDD06472.1 DNA mismatch repair protein MutS [Aureibacter tunicatorum]
MIDSFKHKANEAALRKTELEKKSRNIAIVRVCLFIFFICGIIFFANSKMLALIYISIAAFMPTFILLLKFHQRTKAKKSFYHHLENLNQREISRLEHKFNDLDGGTEFINTNHNYSSDLDIFGDKSSLFQLINHTTTIHGRKTLAKWLDNIPSKETITSRQRAIKELCKQEDWCQKFETIGLSLSEKLKNKSKNIKVANIDKLSKWEKLASYIMPISFLLTSLLCFSLDLSFYLVLIPVSILFFTMKKKSMQLADLSKTIEEEHKQLEVYEKLFDEIEKKSFDEEYLNQIKAHFTKDNIKASIAIKQLKNIVYLLNNRANAFFPIFNFIFGLDLHYVSYLNQWNERYAQSIDSWLSKIGEMESLNSLAQNAIANPNQCYPKINDNRYFISSSQLGHPLIASSSRVSNDFQLNGDGKLALITGSNMSGKSTFLRTIGINIAMAYAGGTVCAKAFEVSIMNLFTSMRTNDNLEENTSSFYAELKRIESLINQIKNDQMPTLFMLDEILKGTNSADRHKGAKALILQLHEGNSSGFISTHDLALGELAIDNHYIDNYHFSSDIDNDKLHFDYKIKKGVCESFNASVLMKQIGIKI